MSSERLCVKKCSLERMHVVAQLCKQKSNKALKKAQKSPAYAGLFDGERGIRTLGDISATFDFESSALDQLSHLSIAAERTADNIMRTQR